MLTMAGERDLITGVIQLANLFIKRLAPVFEKAKITPQQWSVLSALADESTPVTLVALARRLVVTKQNMTGMIARLEQLGLAERQGDPNDLRSSRVTLTRRGRSLVERVRPAYDEWVGALAGGEVSERELQALAKTVERLIGQLEG
ncbi:MAG: MarR family transcriptional regulator, organic hydroperoxide resistance regulator [Acidobacteriota bacterium]|nr:MarR family transcriptional regulator, organic hydroperoxide resistance regulator [Acidobacteriota bacterium]